MHSPATAPLTAIVLTYNEERNLPQCLSSLAGWTQRVFVVDSGSTDRTRKIARDYCAQVIVHPFETHARQWNWALQSLPSETEWILALDADQRVTPQLRDEILERLPGVPEEVHGYYVRRKQIFRGRWIKHGGYYPKYLLKLFRRGYGYSDENELLDFRFYVSGKTGKLSGDIVEENRNEERIDFWLDKHIRFATLQAREEWRRRQGNVAWKTRPTAWGNPDQRVLFRKHLWYRLPLYIRPFLYFGYRYFIRFGFLDGKEGFVFHFLQAFWYRLIVDVKLDELRRSHLGEDTLPREEAEDVAVRRAQ